MALLIHLITFIVFIKVSNGIKCIDETEVQFSSSELNLSQVREILNNLKRKDKKKCRVYMELDSIAETLVIKFNHSTTVARLRSVENALVQISTSLILANSYKVTNQTSIKTKLYLMCRKNNQCDSEFVMKYLYSLMKTNYKKLESTIRSLILIPDENKYECTIGYGNNVEPCYNASCSWYYSIDTMFGKGKCEYMDLHRLPMLQLDTDIRMLFKNSDKKDTKLNRTIFKHRSSIKFWCKLNNCNNHKVGKLVEQTVRKQYVLWKIH